MIVGKNYQLKNEYNVLLNYVVARNSECEGIYFIGDLAALTKIEKHNYGDSTLCELYCNHSKHRMTDEELILIGDRILEVYLTSFQRGVKHTQQNLQHTIGITNTRSQYTDAGFSRRK